MQKRKGAKEKKLSSDENATKRTKKSRKACRSNKAGGSNRHEKARCLQRGRLASMQEATHDCAGMLQMPVFKNRLHPVPQPCI